MLAKKAVGCVSPNPLVGAIIVTEGKIIAEGYHQCCGGDHAERDALKKVKDVNGATIYVSLEPCAHHGRTPPCTDAIIAAGISRVVFAVRDPNPKVRREDPVKILKKAGIKITYPVCEQEARELNKAFFMNHEHNRPYVIWKSAMSMNGKIGVPNKRIMITGKSAERYVHQLRYQVDAVLVGAGTVRTDNPQLTCRLPGKKKMLWKIILGSKKSFSKNTKLLKDPQAIFVEDSRNLKKTLQWLYREYKIGSILVEGGSQVNTSFLKAGLIDEVHLFVAKKKITEANALDLVTDRRMLKKIRIHEIKKIGKDLLWKGALV